MTMRSVPSNYFTFRYAVTLWKVFRQEFSENLFAVFSLVALMLNESSLSEL